MTQKITIPYIIGDGTGPDIWNASREALDEAIIKAYNGDKTIEWLEVIAGQKALDRWGVPLPDETIDTIREYGVAIKGPLTTPVGGGFRSINVYLRQIFDLYVCIRPIRYFQGLPSPLKEPERVDLIVLRENQEDLYKGIEWKAGTDEAGAVAEFLEQRMGVALSEDTGIGIKPISKTNTTRFTRWAIEYAIRQKRRVITVVHKGNIMKFTEGAFREWAYEVAGEYKDQISFNEENGKIGFNDRIADNMFMQVILRPDEYDILLCPNLNGDYLSDACAALIGGLGVAPGGNIGDDVAIYEPTHGSAPKYAGKDIVNPTSFLLSAVLMYRHLGLERASIFLERAVEETIREGVVTYDLARQFKEAIRPVKCSEFGRAVTERVGSVQL